MVILLKKQLGQQQLRKCNSLDRRWQWAPGLPEKVHTAPRSSDQRPGGRQKEIESEKKGGETQNSRGDLTH